MGATPPEWMAEALARVERWRAAQKLAVAKGLETATRLAEAVASEGRLRAALERLEPYCVALTFYEMNKPRRRYCKICNVYLPTPGWEDDSEPHREGCPLAALAAPAPGGLGELLAELESPGDTGLDREAHLYGWRTATARRLRAALGQPDPEHRCAPEGRLPAPLSRERR